MELIHKMHENIDVAITCLITNRDLTPYFFFSLTSHFRAYYSRLLDGRQREQGIRTKMLVKIAAKMLVIAWTLMKRKEPFNPAHIQA